VWLRVEIKIVMPSQRLLYHNDDAAFRKRSWSFFSNATPANYTTTILITGQHIELMGDIFKHSSLPVQTCLLPRIFFVEFTDTFLISALRWIEVLQKSDFVVLNLTIKKWTQNISCFFSEYRLIVPADSFESIVSSVNLLRSLMNTWLENNYDIDNAIYI